MELLLCVCVSIQPYLGAQFHHSADEFVPHNGAFDDASLAPMKRVQIRATDAAQCHLRGNSAANF